MKAPCASRVAAFRAAKPTPGVLPLTPNRPFSQQISLAVDAVPRPSALSSKDHHVHIPFWDLDDKVEWQESTLSSLAFQKFSNTVSIFKRHEEQS